MRLYRVCTENKNYPDILDYLDKHFPDGYTVIHANGAWQGKREKSLVIEIMAYIAGAVACAAIALFGIGCLIGIGLWFWKVK